MDTETSPHLAIFDPHKLLFDFMEVPYYEDEMRDFNISSTDPRFEYLFESLPFFHHKMFLICQCDSSLFWELLEQLYDVYLRVQDESYLQESCSRFGCDELYPNVHHHKVIRDHLFAHLLNIEDV